MPGIRRVAGRAHGTRPSSSSSGEPSTRSASRLAKMIRHSSSNARNPSLMWRRARLSASRADRDSSFSQPTPTSRTGSPCSSYVALPRTRTQP